MVMVIKYFVKVREFSHEPRKNSGMILLRTFLNKSMIVTL